MPYPFGDTHRSQRLLYRYLSLPRAHVGRPASFKKHPLVWVSTEVLEQRHQQRRLLCVIQSMVIAPCEIVGISEEHHKQHRQGKGKRPASVAGGAKHALEVSAEFTHEHADILITGENVLKLLIL